MDTIAKTLIDWSNRLESEVEAFLESHGRIYLWNLDRPDSGVVVITGTPFAWGDLADEGRIAQSRLLGEYTRWSELVTAVLAASAESVRRDFASAQAHVFETIDQSKQTPHESIGKARVRVGERFAEMRRVLEPVRKGDGGPPILIPDTNALLHEPRLEDWAFSDVPEFEIVLLPTVLAELDELKVNYRRDAVRVKAEQIIRRVKGFRNRGQLTLGVPLRKGRSTLRAVAAEPRSEAMPTWLEQSNADDRVLAAGLEIMRAFPARAVVLVTRDLNMQNKAEFARFPFLEPPELDGDTA